MRMRNAALAVFTKTFAPFALVSAVGMVGLREPADPLLVLAAGASFGLSLCLYGLVFGPSVLARGFGPLSARLMIGLGMLAGFAGIGLDLADGSAPFLFLEPVAINRALGHEETALLLFGLGLGTCTAGAILAVWFAFSGRVGRIAGVDTGPLPVSSSDSSK